MIHFHRCRQILAAGSFSSFKFRRRCLLIPAGLVPRSLYITLPCLFLTSPRPHYLPNTSKKSGIYFTQRVYPRYLRLMFLYPALFASSVHQLQIKCPRLPQPIRTHQAASLRAINRSLKIQKAMASVSLIIVRLTNIEVPDLADSQVTLPSQCGPSPSSQSATTIISASTESTLLQLSTPPLLSLALELVYLIADQLAMPSSPHIGLSFCKTCNIPLIKNIGKTSLVALGLSHPHLFQLLKGYKNGKRCMKESHKGYDCNRGEFEWLCPCLGWLSTRSRPLLGCNKCRHLSHLNRWHGKWPKLYMDGKKVEKRENEKRRKTDRFYKQGVDMLPCCFTRCRPYLVIDFADYEARRAKQKAKWNVIVWYHAANKKNYLAGGEESGYMLEPFGVMARGGTLADEAEEKSDLYEKTADGTSTSADEDQTSG